MHSNVNGDPFFLWWMSAAPLEIANNYTVFFASTFDLSLVAESMGGHSTDNTRVESGPPEPPSRCRDGHLRRYSNRQA